LSVTIPLTVCVNEVESLTCAVAVVYDRVKSSNVRYKSVFI
jgi:hypothetical protein